MNQREIKQTQGDCLMQVDISIASTRIHYPEYSFYEFFLRGKRGSLIALPFYSSSNEFEGYLIYQNKNSYGYSKQELERVGNESIVKRSQSGTISDLILLPYKPISKDDSEEEIEDAILKIIEKNVTINLSENLLL